MTPRPEQHREMHVRWRKAGVSHRGDRLALTGAIVDRDINTSNELSEAEAERVITYQRDLDRDGLLAQRAGQWLRARRRVMARTGS